MSRRSRPEKPEIPPDPRFNSTHVQSFINRVMKNGKKSVAASTIYTALDIVEERTKKGGLEVFEQAMKNVGPVMEVKPRRVGGATYQVPMEVPPHRRFALACWLISAEGSLRQIFAEKLAGELMDAANNTGSAIRKRRNP
jgi:small subunit ribosomal protein S7